jgi:hypothetical protein
MRNKRVLDMSMDPPPGAGYTLRDIDWSEDVLRLQILAMMARCLVDAADVIRAWDKNRDRELSCLEFLSNLEPFFKGSKDFFRSEIAPIARRAFEGMARKAGEAKVFEPKLSVTELERWLRAAPNESIGAPPPLRSTSPKATKKALRSSRRSPKRAPSPPKPKPFPSADALSSPIFRALVLQMDTPRATGAGADGASSVLSQLHATVNAAPRVMATTTAMQLAPSPRVDVSSIAHAHARFWNGRRGRRYTERSHKLLDRLPPLSPRAKAKGAPDFEVTDATGSLARVSATASLRSQPLAGSASYATSPRLRTFNYKSTP